VKLVTSLALAGIVTIAINQTTTWTGWKQGALTGGLFFLVAIINLGRLIDSIKKTPRFLRSIVAMPALRRSANVVQTTRFQHIKRKKDSNN
jgi:hypothetical protein